MEAKSILLVEDNPDDEQLTLRALRQSEVASSIRVARDGAEALDALFRNGELREFDLVLLDLKLPKKNGFDVLRELRAHPAAFTLPVVVMTSSDEERDIQEARRLGANSFVSKPTDFREYMEAVRQIAFYWLAVNHA